MTRNTSAAKRKIAEDNKKPSAEDININGKSEIVEEVSFDSDNDDGFFNVVNDDDGDSSDSEGDVEDSGDEIGKEDDAESNDESSNEEEEVENESDEDDSEEESDENEVDSDENAVDSDENGNSSDESDKDEKLDQSSEESDSDKMEIKLAEKRDTEIVDNPTQSTKNVAKPTKTTKKATKVGKKTSKSEDSVPDEYQNDSSDEEDIRNTVGNVPQNWYADFKHMGYDWDGKQIIKPGGGEVNPTEHIDEFLRRVEDPDFWRTVKDPQTGQDVVLSEADIGLIKRVQAGKIPDESFDDYAPWIEWFSSQVEEMPLRKFPEHKRSFLPSRDEARQVSKLVHALKMGWIKTREEAAKLRAKKAPQFYMLWQSDDQQDESMRRIHKHIPAPKRHLPGHAESYNPPSEYLFDDRELKRWNKQQTAPWKRKVHFVPQKYASLRAVPGYSRFIKERFLRCLDLYLCPRAIKMRLTIEPDALVPILPSPRDLQPFPTVLSLEYRGHGDMVRALSIDRSGQYLVSGSDDGVLKVWEVNTARCLRSLTLASEGDEDTVVRSVDWCPNVAISLILVACGKRVLLINPHVGDFLIAEKTDSLLQAPPASNAAAENITSQRIATTVQWKEPTPAEKEMGVLIVLEHFRMVAQVCWHGRGDYFASVMPEGAQRSVLISQLSRRRSQVPFGRNRGLVQCVLFHPIRPVLFVATQRHVRVYDLVQQAMVKKLMTNSRWISRMAVHPAGDNLLVATYDRKLLWFDLDLSTKPYQTLRLHGTAVRGVAFHRRYPLFASGSDDRSLIVSHGMVYNDLLQNPLIVPLKRLQDHTAKNDFGIFEVIFHPLQPWVFSSGADGTIKMYCN